MRLKSIPCHEDVRSRQSTWSQGVLGLLWTSECHIFVILPHSEWECLLWLPCLIPPISTHVIAGISQLFHKGPDSECVRLCGPYVLCSNNSIVHGSMKAAIENFNGCGCIPVKLFLHRQSGMDLLMPAWEDKSQAEGEDEGASERLVAFCFLVCVLAYRCANFLKIRQAVCV